MVVDDPQNLLEIRIRKNIAENKISDLLPALEVGETYHVSNALLLEGWQLSATYLEEKGEWPSAIIAYNKARRLNSTDVANFNKLLDACENFFTRHKNDFSKNDLFKLLSPIEMIINFHSIRFPSQEKAIKRGEDLLLRIKYYIEFKATEAIETSLSHHVNRIYNAITDDMTLEEVKEELARTLAPIIRKRLSQKKKDDASSSKK